MGSTQHPKLKAALDAAHAGDVAAVVGIALRARAAADDGRYCQCDEPLLAGLDLMCGACLLNNGDQEVRKLLSIYGAHDFDPDTSTLTRRAMRWCKCTYPADDPRHHGFDRPCRTSWGEELVPPYDDLRASLAEATTDG